MLLFVPIALPFKYHWYVGVPPFTGVAVNVTFVPSQIVVASAAIVMLTGRFGFTVIVTVSEVAGLPVEHVASDINTQYTSSLSVSVALE